jgi:HTH-type transcriptional repressor of NAD biosynthesis genes
MTIGVVTGKFAPLHTGHIFMINSAATQCDELYVVLSYDGKFQAELPIDMQYKMTFSKRLRWLKETFKDVNHIHIVSVDETDIPSYPDGCAQWAELVSDVLPTATKSPGNMVWFSSEPEYAWWIEKYFAAEHILIDSNRTTVPISASKIRKDPRKYWEFMPSIVRMEFLLKVVLIGTESVGKTTLTKYLAKLLNTSWVEEYGRTFCEQDLLGDESLLQFDHYGDIAMRRYQMEQEASRSANRVVIADTNAFVTQYYCNLYEGKSNPLVDHFINIEEYDVILNLDDDVEWVDDGLRVNTDRKYTKAIFNNMIDQYGIDRCNIYNIAGSYQQRFKDAYRIIMERV